MAGIFKRLKNINSLLKGPTYTEDTQRNIANGAENIGNFLTNIFNPIPKTIRPFIPIVGDIDSLGDMLSATGKQLNEINNGKSLGKAMVDWGYEASGVKGIVDEVSNAAKNVSNGVKNLDNYVRTTNQIVSNKIKDGIGNAVDNIQKFLGIKGGQGNPNAQPRQPQITPDVTHTGILGVYNGEVLRKGFDDARYQQLRQQGKI